MDFEITVCPVYLLPVCNDLCACPRNTETTWTLRSVCRLFLKVVKCLISWQLPSKVTVHLCAGAVRGPNAGAGRAAPKSGVEQRASPLETQPCLGILFKRTSSLTSYFSKIDVKYRESQAFLFGLFSYCWK